MTSMMTANRADKLAAARKKLRKYQKKKEEEDSAIYKLDVPVSSSHFVTEKVIAEGEDQLDSFNSEGFVANSTVEHAIDEASFAASASPEQMLPYETQEHDSFRNGAHWTASESAETDTREEFKTLAKQSATKVGESDDSTHSSTEQLKMLTMKLNELVSDSRETAEVKQSLDLVDMYKNRSIDLTQKIDMKNQEIEKLCREIAKLKATNQQIEGEKTVLEGRFNNFKMEAEYGQKSAIESLEREKENLSKQMANYSQTVDMLVSEKSVLEKQLEEANLSLNKERSLGENMKNIIQLEQGKYGELKSQYDQYVNNMNQNAGVKRGMESERNSLLSSVDSLRTRVEELSSENAELQTKLYTQVSECEKLKNDKKALQDWVNTARETGRGSDGGIVPGPGQELEGLRREKQVLEERLSEFNMSLDILNEEKLETDRQWRLDSETIKSLQENVKLKNKEISDLREENNTLVHQNATLGFSVEELTTSKNGLIAQVDELRRRKSSIASASDNSAASAGSLGDAEEKIGKEYDDTIRMLEKKLLASKEELELYTKTNGEMKSLIMKQAEDIASLESRVSRSKEESGQRSQLLEKMRSDAETISRATMQNKQLKEQLIDLQDRLSELTKENALLLSKTHMNSNESPNVFQHTAEEVDSLKEKNNELEELVSKLSHYKDLVESKGNEDESSLLENLSNQLQAKAVELDLHAGTNKVLTEELNTLRGKLKESDATLQSYSSKINALESGRDLLPDIAASENAWNEEREKLLSKISSLQAKAVEPDEIPYLDENENQAGKIASEKISEAETSLRDQTAELSRRIKELETEKNNLKQDFYIVKDQFEEISEQKKELIIRLAQEEKINAQLSLESETIGEYITLYQSQRMAIKTKLEEKERFIQSIKLENESLINKLKEVEDVAFEIYHEKKSLEKRVSANGVENVSETVPNVEESIQIIQRSSSFVDRSLEFPPCRNCSYEVLRV